MQVEITRPAKNTYCSARVKRALLTGARMPSEQSSRSKRESASVYRPLRADLKNLSAVDLHVHATLRKKCGGGGRSTSDESDFVWTPTDFDTVVTKYCKLLVEQLMTRLKLRPARALVQRTALTVISRPTNFDLRQSRMS